MNPWLPLTGNPPHAALMPVRPRDAVGPRDVNVSSSGAKPWSAGQGKARRNDAHAESLLMMLMVAIGVVLGLTALFISR
jgi:hypothetical protein